MRPTDNPTVPDDTILATLDQVGSQRKAAEILGISRAKVRSAKTRASRLREDDTTPTRPLSAAAPAFGVQINRNKGARAGRTIGDTFTQAGFTGSTSMFVGFVAPDGTPGNRDWKASVFTSADLEDMPASKLATLLLTGSAEVSKGAHDFVRLFNPGNEVHCYRPGTDDMDDAAEEVLHTEVLGTIKRHYVSLNVIFHRLALSLFVRGAMLAESVLSKEGDRFVDFVVADPSSVAFRREPDDERGFYWQMGQWQGSKWIPLESELIAYVPFDSMPDSPYGRSPMLPALFPALFLMGFMQDLRRVVANAGYNRIALKVNVESLLATMQAMRRGQVIKESDFLEFLSDVKRTINNEFGALDPGDALVTDTNLEVENLAGTITTMNPGSMEGIVTALERMCVKALKSIPLLHGITESTSDANANRQWEMLVAAIKDMQHLAEDLLGRLLTTTMQAMGYVTDVRVEFSELRAAEMLRDEQVAQLRIENAERRMNLGWNTPREAAMDATGFVSDAVEETYDDPDGSAAEGNDVITDEAAGGGGSPDAADVSADPAADRVTKKIRRKRGTRAVSTSAEVTTFDEAEAARVFDEMVPTLAGILEAETVVEDDAA